MRVAITGAGLLGTHAAAALARRGHEVLVYDIAPDRAYVSSVLAGAPVALVEGDITDLAAFEAALRAHRADTVVHTAALIGGNAQRHACDAFRVNVGGTATAAEAARRVGARRVIYASTRGVYDAASVAGPAIAEDGPTAARSVYAASKLAAEHVLEAYAAFLLAVVVLRFCNVFGRGHYRGGSGRGRALDELVRGALRRAPTALPAALAGSQEWLYVKDAARAIAASVERDVVDGFTVVNVGSGVLRSDEDLAAAIRGAVPGAAVTAASAHSAGDRPRPPLDVRRARERLGFVPEYDLASALADYVAETRAAAAAT